MNRAIKFRINPTEEQKELFARTIGCCRKVWNLMLDERETADLTEGLSCRPTPAKYKKEYHVRGNDDRRAGYGSCYHDLHVFTALTEKQHELIKGIAEIYHRKKRRIDP